MTTTMMNAEYLKIGNGLRVHGPLQKKENVFSKMKNRSAGKVLNLVFLMLGAVHPISCSMPSSSIQMFC